MSDHINRVSGNVDEHLYALKDDVPNKNEFDELRNTVTSATEDLREVKDEIEDMKEDIDLLDKAKRDSSERLRSLMTQIGMLLVGGIITALLSQFIG